MAFCLSAAPPVYTVWAWRGCCSAILLYTLFILTACSFNAQLLCFLIPLLGPFKYILIKVWPTNTQSIKVSTLAVQNTWGIMATSHCFDKICFAQKCFSPLLSSQFQTRQEIYQCMFHIVLLMNCTSWMWKKKVCWISLDASSSSDIHRHLWTNHYPVINNTVTLFVLKELLLIYYEWFINYGAVLDSFFSICSYFCVPHYKALPTDIWHMTLFPFNFLFSRLNAKMRVQLG